MDKVVHFEIPADDLSRAKKFYQDTFGWRMQDMPEMNYILATTVETGENHTPKEPGTINGGMMQKNSMITGPTFSISVKDIDEAIEKVKRAGGLVVKEKVAVGTMGFVAYFKDTEGNVLSMWQNA